MNKIPPPCCGPGAYTTGQTVVDPQQIPRVGTTLSFRDQVGRWQVRWGINRMKYLVTPGLYAVGQPDDLSPVLVTANYKLSFDMLRKELAGLSAWILVIDTRGVNVWCAAGKGTFGTKELVNRINTTQLAKVVSHRRIILPQLGAPGVAAHEITRQTGFKVVYGPIRAADIRQFIGAGLKASPQMREVTFNWWERLVLTPMELVASAKALVIIYLILFLYNLISPGPLFITDLIATTWLNFLPILGAAFIGIFLVPLLLPWIPGRPFSLKGLILGIPWTGVVLMFPQFFALPASKVVLAAYALVMPAITAYLAFNFTGCTTFTSFSGVKLETKYVLPLSLCAVILGVILLLGAKIVEWVSFAG